MFKKFRDWKALHCKIEELEREVERKEAEKRVLKDDIADLKHKKKLEDEDIKHLVRLTKEKQEVEFERRVMTAEKEKDAAIAKVKDEYRDKVERQLSEQKNDIKGMYSEIMDLVPKIKVGLKGEVG
jgi:phosphoglycolate phosphatase-like HAD superfamily hydrolase